MYVVVAHGAIVALDGVSAIRLVDRRNVDATVTKDSLQPTDPSLDAWQTHGVIDAFVDLDTTEISHLAGCRTAGTGLLHKIDALTLDSLHLCPQGVKLIEHLGGRAVLVKIASVFACLGPQVILPLA
jgi:hypothetical protein